MEAYPRTLLDFEKRFPSEESCREYLFQQRWPHGFECPRCSGRHFWADNSASTSSRRRDLYECAQCGHQTSLTAGTIFQDTKKPLRLWFRAMWQVTNQKYGANALGLQRALGLGSYRTAWSWLHKLRRAMVRPDRDRLSGIVEVDETYIGGPRSGKAGRGAAGKVLGMIAAQVDGTRIGRIRLLKIADASAESLITAVKKAVTPGAVIRTDGWSGYTPLKTSGYLHEIVRDDAVVGEDRLPSCHRVASLLKRWLLGTHQGAVSAEHLEYYLDEFTFRFNRRTSRSRGLLFYRLVQQAAACDPVPVKQIVKKARGETSNHNI